MPSIPPRILTRILTYEDILRARQRHAAARFAGITIGIALFFLGAALVLFLASCNSTQATLHGVAIKNQAVANATRTMHIAEVAAATGVRIMTAGIASGVITPEVGEVFVQDIDPKVKSAMLGVKNVLRTMEKTPSDTTAQKVIEATLILQDVLNTVHAYLLDPTAFVATQGALP